MEILTDIINIFTFKKPLGRLKFFIYNIVASIGLIGLGLFYQFLYQYKQDYAIFINIFTLLIFFLILIIAIFSIIMIFERFWSIFGGKRFAIIGLLVYLISMFFLDNLTWLISVILILTKGKEIEKKDETTQEE